MTLALRPEAQVVVDNSSQLDTVVDSPRQLDWIKAERSYGLGECVELAVDGNSIRLRDSKNPSVHLHFTHAEMAAFIDGARRGEFDHLLD